MELKWTYYLHRRDIIVVQRFTKESRVDSYKCLLHTSLSPPAQMSKIEMPDSFKKNGYNQTLEKQMVRRVASVAAI